MIDAIALGLEYMFDLRPKFHGSLQARPSAPNSGKCLPNVNSFITEHLTDAQTLAGSLGNGVTPPEVLAVAGNETGYRGGFAQYGKYFGLHGAGLEPVIDFA